MGTPGCVNERPEGKRDCGKFREQPCTWSGRETLTKRNWRPVRTSRNPTMMMTANGESANKKRSHGKCPRNGFIRDGNASWWHTQQFFLSERSAKIMGTLTTGPAVKNHISPKNGKRIICSIANYVPFVVPGCRRVPVHHHHQLLQYLHRRRLRLARENWLQKEVRVWVQSDGETCRVNQWKTPKKEDDEELRSGLHNLPDWLAGVQRECGWITNEPRAKVVPRLGEHSICTHFPKVQTGAPAARHIFHICSHSTDRTAQMTCVQ